MKVVPLSGSFLMTSIIGFLISVFYVFRKYPDWGFAFMIVFAVMFVSAFVSIMYASPEELILVDNERIRQEDLGKNADKIINEINTEDEKLKLKNNKKKVITKY